MDVLATAVRGTAVRLTVVLCLNDENGFQTRFKRFIWYVLNTEKLYSEEQNRRFNSSCIPSQREGKLQAHH